MFEVLTRIERIRLAMMIAGSRGRVSGAGDSAARVDVWPTRGSDAYGLLMYGAHLASFVPCLANAVTQTPVVRDVFTALLRLPPGVRIPRSARRTFKTWFAARGARGAAEFSVILFADTFTNYFDPDRGIAAVAVLERAGYRVVVPQGTLCCGGPLYPCGRASLATTLGREVLEALRPHLQAGVPVVALDSRCVDALRDTLGAYVDDPAIARLRDGLRLLPDFLADTSLTR